MARGVVDPTCTIFQEYAISDCGLQVDTTTVPLRVRAWVVRVEREVGPVMDTVGIWNCDRTTVNEVVFVNPNILFLLKKFDEKVMRDNGYVSHAQ